MTIRLALSLFALSALAAPSVRAADAAPAGVAACQSCHGVTGISPGVATPNLAGQKAGYLAAQLAAFKTGDRKHELMQAVAGQLSDDDMTGLAQYWSAQVAGGAATPAAIASRMTLPAGFPAGFTAYQTLDQPADKLVVKRYANAVALRAARAGQPLPDGSMIVAVNYARRPDGSAGAATSYSAMEAKAGWGEAVPALIRNGNWDYALFTADGVRRDLNQAQCLACHKPIASDSYVFSIKALRAAAAKPAG